MTEFSFLTLSPYLCLFFAVILSLRKSSSMATLVFSLMALVLGFFTEVFDGVGLVVLLLTPVSFFIWINHYFAEVLRKLGLIVFIGCAYLLGTHSLEGIQNLQIFEDVAMNRNSAPYNMFFNFDKVFLALVIYNLLPPIERRMKFKASLGNVIKTLIAAIVVILPIAILTSYIEWQPNANPYVILWAVNNLFFVCFSEEVIFRRFIQNQLVKYFRITQYGDLIAIFASALLFGFAHWSGGFIYVGLASLAGIFYGFCFYHTCNVRSSMAVHFSINLIHVLFFTYPFYA